MASKKVKRTRVQRTYSHGQLLSALDAMSKGTSLVQASATFGIPKTTLSRRFRSGRKDICRFGPQTVLTNEEEESLVRWILECARRGQPQTGLQIRFAAKKLLLQFPRPNPFKNSLPSEKWLKKFMERHNMLAYRKPEALSTASGMVRKEDLLGWWAYVDAYFESKRLKEIMSDNSRVLNCDESFIEYNPDPKRVVVASGSKNVHINQTSGAKTGCTFMHTVSNNLNAFFAFIFFA